MVVGYVSCDIFASADVIGLFGDVEAGRVTIVLANLGVGSCREIEGAIPNGRLQGLDTRRRWESNPVADPAWPTLLGDANICGALLGMRNPCGRTLEDKRAEGRAIVRVHILDPATVAIDS